MERNIIPDNVFVSLVESGGQNYTVANMYMFDETVGQFWYNNLLSANNVGVPELGLIVVILYYLEPIRQQKIMPWPC